MKSGLASKRHLRQSQRVQEQRAAGKLVHGGEVSI
jgi:hypothetical protein